MDSNRLAPAADPGHARMPVLFVSHGAGPLPLLRHPTHEAMREAFADLRPELPEPTAVLLVSAHWESDTVSVTAGGAPGLLYDYYGFPEESYRITYPAPGAPALARDVRARLSSEGFTVRLETDRDFDHGMFVPMKLLFPDANVPTVQVSLKGSLDPVEHLAIGSALEGLRERKVI